MDNTSRTSRSLLQRCRDWQDKAAWQRLNDIYSPFIRGVLRKKNIAEHDAADLVQQVLTIVAEKLPSFEYDPGRGTFRAWLRTITVYCLLAFWDKRNRRGTGTGGSDFREWLDQLEDLKSEASRKWDLEHDTWVANKVAELVRPNFADSTWQAFWQTEVEGKPVKDVAAELGLTAAAVYIARSRVRQRLKEEREGLID